MEKEEIDVKSTAQAGQDAFVALALDGKIGGTFVDLGAGDPKEFSNTFTLERFFGWSGILADIATKDALIEKRSSANKIFGDALDRKVVEAILELAKKDDDTIDFLSLDLEPPEVTLSCLSGLPLDRVLFRVLTVEHDRYRGNSIVKFAMNGILEGFGYERVAEDVRMIARYKSGRHGLVPVEDWWIHPSLVDAKNARHFAAEIRHESESRARKIIEQLNAEISQHE